MVSNQWLHLEYEEADKTMVVAGPQLHSRGSNMSPSRGNQV